MTNFYYNPASPGAGKTQRAIKEALDDLQTGQSFLFVVPTIVLAQSIYLRSIYYDNGSIIKPIHSTDNINDISVNDRILDEIRKANNKLFGTALVITYEAFVNITNKSLLSDWIIYLDEPKEPLVIKSFDVSDSKVLIERYFIKKTHVHGNLFKILEVGNEVKFKNKNDAMTGFLAQIKYYIDNPVWFEVLFDKEALDKGNLRYSVLTKPQFYDMFNEVRFMSAYFTTSVLYNIYKNLGLTWSIQDYNLTDIDSSRITIEFMQFGTGNSKSWRDAINNAGKTNLDSFIGWVNKILPNDRFVYVFNNEYDIKLDSPNAVAMPAECHGLNDYMDYDIVVLGASYLVNDSFNPFYDYYGISSRDMRIMRNLNYLLQQLTRTDIRNRDSNKPIRVIVPVSQDALDIASICTKAMLQDASGKQYKLKDDFQLMRNPNDYEIPNPDEIHFVTTGNRIFQTHPYKIPCDFDPCNSLINKDFRKNDGGYYSILPTPKNAKSNILSHMKAITYPLLDSDWDTVFDDDTIDYLKKNVLPWVSPGIYDVIGQDEYGNMITENLTKDNLKGARFLGLDLDDTLLTDKQISKAMKQYTYAQYYTISNDPMAERRRLRLIVPFDRPVSIDEYDRIMSYFINRFKDVVPDDDYAEQLFESKDDYIEDYVGFDATKLGAYCKFFLPINKDVLKIVTYKNNRKTTIMDVEKILQKIPKPPLFKVATYEDMVSLEQKPLETTFYKSDSLFEKLSLRIDDMMDGNRNDIAMEVAGKMKYCDDRDKLLLFNKILSKGKFSASQIRGMRRYGEL